MKSKSTRIRSRYFLGIGGKICASLLTGFAIALPNHSVLAQIIPDTTLGAEASVVTPLTSQFNQIKGGAIRGVNLFHSFKYLNKIICTSNFSNHYIFQGFQVNPVCN